MSGPARGAPRPVAPFPVFLFRRERPLLVVPAAAALSLLGALLLSNAAASFGPALGEPKFAVSGWAFMFAVAIRAPVVETAIMAGVIELLRRFLPPWPTAIASAAGWGIAHSMAASAWGLVIWWPFLIFSALYLVWRQRSIASAYAVAASVHALQNAIPAAGMAFG